MDRPRSREGSVVAATWLIGIGVVFLLQQAMNVGWGVAWPLFVILVGAASLVSDVVWQRHRRPTPWSFTGSLVTIVVGLLLLGATTGWLGVSLGELISRWWPVGLIILGAWFLIGAVWPRSAAPDRLDLPLEGATQAEVRIRFGAGQLTVGAAAAGMLVDGRFEGGVVHRLSGPGVVELEPENGAWGWVDRRQRWQVGLTREVPLNLRIEGGAARSDIDLGEHQLRSLRIQTGASETRVALPSAAGQTRVNAEAGAAQLTFDVPQGVAARIRSRMALGSSSIDDGRFPRTGDTFESPNYESATNRVEIDIQGGVGSVRVR